jgi:NAD(P)-dependent dehydrogenase (short-subunit alcohol dehydrogenase family)
VTGVGKLEGRVAAITGGTRGIGRGIAEAFLAEGGLVAINGRSADKGELAMKEIDASERSWFFAGDVTRREDVEAFIDGTVGHFGNLDIMVNNAGGAAIFAPVAELSDDGWQQAIDWNLNSTFWGCRRALRYMIPKQSGRIINMSSIEGKHGKAGLGGYVAAKHAINGLTKTIAREVGTLGITCNSLCPGLLITDIVRDQGTAAASAMGLSFDEMVQQYAAESAIKRPNSIEEVAAAAVLLASDAGSGITGSTLSVDGGTSAY